MPRLPAVRPEPVDGRESHCSADHCPITALTARSASPMADCGDSSLVSALLSCGCSALIASTHLGCDSISVALGRYFSHTRRCFRTGSALFWNWSDASTFLLTGSFPASDHSNPLLNR